MADENNIQDDELSSSAAYVEQMEADSPLAETLERLPTFVSRGLLYLLLLFAVIGLIYATFSTVDVIRSLPAEVAPEGRVYQLQPDVAGTVMRINVREGDVVQQNDELIVIDSKEVVQHLSALRAAQVEQADSHREQTEVVPLKEQQLAAQIKILDEKVASLKLTQTALEQRRAREDASLELTSQLQDLELVKQDELLKRVALEAKNAAARHELWKTELETMKKLVEAKAASELQFLSAQRSRDEAAGELEKHESLRREYTEQKQIEKVKLDIARNNHAQTIAQIQENLGQNLVAIQSALLEKLQLQSQVDVLKMESNRRHSLAEFRLKQARELARLNLPGVDDETLDRIAQGGVATDQSVIRAPVAGRIGQLGVHHSGQTVANGQTVITLVPEDARLVVELRVSNKDIGLLSTGLPVRLKVDAFPFAEYGVLSGRLTEITTVAETPQNPQQVSFYRAYAEIDQDYFWVKGNQVPLLPGMTATAEVITERKTLLMLILKPLMEFGKPNKARS